MGLYEKITTDMKDALKKKEAVRLSTLRLLLAAIRNAEIEKKAAKLEDPDILQIIQKQVKQRRDSIEQFKKGSRQDLADKEALEIAVLESYMPAQLAAEELIAIVEGAIKESGAVSKRDAGKVMKIVMEKTKGGADGKVVNGLVMERLK